MDQQKIGSFLKELRNEKGLTQEQLAEHVGVTNRSVSRWECGNTLPDISILLELAQFYEVDIKEIIDGERKSENMQEEIDTLKKVAEYTNEDKQQQYKKMKKMIGFILMGFGVFLIISVLMIFPSDSSWGSIYSIIGVIILLIGFYQIIEKHKLIIIICSFVLLISSLIFVDYLGVIIKNQVPRFAYEKEWSEDRIVYRAPFYTVIRYNYDTKNEYLEVIY
ncbi:MAG: helix-turn-helix domain-containing protein [Traorella sp.]